MSEKRELTLHDSKIISKEEVSFSTKITPRPVLHIDKKFPQRAIEKHKSSRHLYVILKATYIPL